VPRFQTGKAWRNNRARGRMSRRCRPVVSRVERAAPRSSQCLCWRFYGAPPPSAQLLARPKDPNRVTPRSRPQRICCFPSEWDALAHTQSHKLDSPPPRHSHTASNPQSLQPALSLLPTGAGAPSTREPQHRRRPNPRRRCSVAAHLRANSVADRKSVTDARVTEDVCLPMKSQQLMIAPQATLVAPDMVPIAGHRRGNGGPSALWRIKVLL
jgi:hypothetical protein